MNKKNIRTYSVYCQDATKLLGYLIQASRKEMRISTTDLAERARISRGTLHKIESGSLNCEIGIAFEVAALVGIKLFNMDSESLASEVLNHKRHLSLLPSRVRKIKGELDDNF